ncbi:MAG TPA: hypothetical protein VFC46_02330 [Humisphaera sp.]|nr:hypothetical protein [Humisphaera sp.]
MSEIAADSSCDLCAKPIFPGRAYIVRMEVFADPKMPPMSGDEIKSMDFDQTLAAVLKEVEAMSADDLQDGVHRSFEYHLCPACHRIFLSNPLGKPRQRQIGKN